MKLGIIGGSGLYKIDGIEDVRMTGVETPFGAPSDEYICGRLEGVEVVFLPRHGRSHSILPSEINHRANIFGMKKLGVTHIVSVSAVGSLRAELKPRDVVVVDQYFDRTKKSLEHTFFGRGVAGHISFGDPVCPSLAKVARDCAEAAAKELGEKPAPVVHTGGTYVNMEGPAFSTKAESNSYRKMGFDVIGMTNLGEAKLSREAEICYCTVAMVTDYDCWHEDHDHVTVEMIIGNLTANASLARNIVRKIAASKDALASGKCGCGEAMKYAIITHKESVPEKLRTDMAPIFGKYLK